MAVDNSLLTLVVAIHSCVRYSGSWPLQPFKWRKETDRHDDLIKHLSMYRDWSTNSHTWGCLIAKTCYFKQPHFPNGF